LNWIEIIGYVASILVAVSLSMNSVARLRALNLLGAGVFALYGFLVGAYPVFAVNAYIAVVNIVFLKRMQPGRSEAFDLLVLDSPTNRYLHRFLEFHNQDIQRFFPGFKAGSFSDAKIVLILKDVIPVGVVICEQADAETLNIKLDYVIPSHRDFRCAEYFYKAWTDIISCDGICRFVARADVKAHRSYLKRMGFLPDEALGVDWFYRPA
jgi:hypothetical protein